jgi:hypothetical protein
MVYKLKWVLPALGWAILSLLSLANVMPMGIYYWEYTFSAIAYYIGSWSSEYIITKLAELYYREFEKEEDISPDVKRMLSELYAVKKRD